MSKHVDNNHEKILLDYQGKPNQINSPNTHPPTKKKKKHARQPGLEKRKLLIWHHGYKIEGILYCVWGKYLAVGTLYIF
jgi:hypothetical protein